MFSEFEKGYISALIDGEGHVTIKREFPNKARKRHAYRPEIAVYNTNLGLLTKFKEILDREGIHCVLSTHTNRHHGKIIIGKKKCYSARIVNLHGVLSILNQINPHLIVWKGRTPLIMEYCGSRIRKIRLKGCRWGRYTKEEEDLVEKIMKIKSGGRT